MKRIENTVDCRHICTKLYNTCMQDNAGLCRNITGACTKYKKGASISTLTRYVTRCSTYTFANDMLLMHDIESISFTGIHCMYIIHIACKSFMDGLD